MQVDFDMERSACLARSEKRAKARLVILGFEDPDISSSVPNDAPTLSKDGKQLVLQKVASCGWTSAEF